MNPAQQSGHDALIEEQVRGAMVRCYADRPRSLPGLLDAALSRSADDVLLVDPALGTATTYAQFACLVEGLAAQLLDDGLTSGDRVAVLVHNGLEAAVTIWACARARLLHVGIPVESPPDRVRSLLHLVGARVLYAQPVLAAPLVGLDVPVRDAAELVSHERAWHTAQPEPDQDATYSLIATSGTTGHPKAVQVTGRMMGHAAAFYSRTLGLTASDRTAIHLPFAWVSGHLTQLAPTMLAGGSAVTMAEFSATSLVRVVEEHAVTWLDVVPSIWELLLRTSTFAAPACSSLRLAVFGGAPAPPGTLERVRERLPQLRLFDVYALSETCAPVTCLSDVEALRRPGSVGRPAPYVELRLVDPDGAVVARDEPGQVQVRSPAVTPGYWGDEPSPLTLDGWLATGDLGRLDAEGYLRIDGRAVDLIIRGGVNIYPAEVERALLATGLLADAAAVGVPSALSGQNVAAVVVARPGAAAEPGLLQTAVRRALGAHAVPRPLRIVGDLPRVANGKPDRPAIVRLLSEPTT